MWNDYDINFRNDTVDIRIHHVYNAYILRIYRIAGLIAAMLRIRLKRVGAKKKPVYRIVVADSRAPRDGAFVDQVGLYNPMTDPPSIDIDEDKVLRWIGNGAKPSEPVEHMLKNMGTLDKLKA